jgi:hypothetical protein
MRITKSTLAVASAVAFAGLLASFASVAVAAEAPHVRGARAHTGVAQHQTNVQVNSGRHVERRNFSGRYSDGNNNYGRHHRRHRGIGFGGISINLGDIDSNCRYSYRKWQNTGSHYWRSRYYDCVG